MQDHICPILAHYIIYLGAKLDLHIDTSTEESIIKNAASRWNKRGVFEWANLPVNDLCQSTDIQYSLPNPDFDSGPLNELIGRPSPNPNLNPNLHCEEAFLDLVNDLFSLESLEPGTFGAAATAVRSLDCM